MIACHGFLKNIKKQKLFSTNKNCFWAENQHTRMISDGSCDSEDWSIGCWKFSFANRNKLNIKIYIKLENFFFKL